MRARTAFLPLAFVLALGGCATDTSKGGPLPATGQDRWYRNDGLVASCDDHGGYDGLSDVPPLQDGRLLAGCPMEGRFVISGAVVEDTCTGLSWQRVPPSGVRTWPQALAFARDLELAGFDDWRAPNIHELLSLVHYGREDPAIHPDFVVSMLPPGDDDVPGTDLPTWYWSSTSALPLPGSEAWAVDFDRGSHDPVATARRLSLRAVRGGSLPRRLPVVPCDGVISP